MNIVKRTLHKQRHDGDPSIKSKKRKLPPSMLSNEKFIACITSLTPHQKSLVENLGFKSLLSLSCQNVSLPLVMWLIQHFDTNTRCIKLDNGFVFQLDAFAMHQILGIPMGPKKINLSQDSDSVETLRKDLKFKGKLPTLKELKAALTSGLSDDAFSRIFILYVISRFLCPTGHHRVSEQFVAPVLQVSEIIKMDWCSPTLDWLVESIILFKRNLDRGIRCKIGGCLFVLVVSYFEFLITSEFTLGAKTPRISLWTTNIVQSYTALDSLDASSGQFGRLPLKHISCTPFSNNERLKHNLPINCLPDFTDTLLKASVPFHLQSEARMYITEAYSDLCKAAIASIAPVINVLTKDVANSLCEKHLNTDGATLGPVQHVDNNCQDSECEGSSCESDDCFDDRNKLYLRQFEEQQIDQLSALFAEMVEVPEIKDTIGSVVRFPEMLQTLSEIPFDLELNIPMSSLNVEDIQSSLFVEACSRCPLPELPQEEVIDLIELAGSGIQPAAPSRWFLQKDEKFDYLPPAITRPRYGKSFSEIFLGKKRSPCFDPHTDVPSFDAIMKSIDEEEADNHETNCGSKNVEDEDSFWQDAVLISDKTIQNKFVCSSHTPGTSFVPASNVTMRDNLRPDTQQVIFSTREQKDMFILLTSNVTKENKKRERIFKIDNVWLDKTIFCFSMRINGWMHAHVMDAFCKMFMTDQVERSRLGKIRPNEVIKSFLHSSYVSWLTDSELFHNDRKAAFTEYSIGYRLENAGLVFIPCCISSQWFAVVANFIDLRFDILNPQKVTSDEIKSVISIIIHNFKGVFMLAYPRCRFNIRLFEANYVDVPKQKYREDSGVLLIRMMQTFTGVEVQRFSNVDVQAIREILLFQLVCFPYNEERPLIAKKYVDAYFAALAEENMKSTDSQGDWQVQQAS